MKKITKNRIANGAILALPIALALSYIWIGDDKNRFWQGKVIGGAIAIVGVVIIFAAIILVGKYRETRSWGSAWGMLKEFILTLLSRDFKGSKKRSNKK